MASLRERTEEKDIREDNQERMVSQKPSNMTNHKMLFNFLIVPWVGSQNVFYSSDRRTFSKWRDLGEALEIGENFNGGETEPPFLCTLPLQVKAV